MKSIILSGLAFSAVFAASPQAALITEPARVFNTSAVIADLQDPPAIFSQSVSDSLVYFITRVEVGLHLVGVTEGAGFASEMFVSLNKDLSATSILLNRIGISPSDSLGAFYDGWNVAFSDSAANGDIHASSELPSGILQGLWQPDGRVDAASSSRPEMLDVFNGDNANGTWSLAVADLEMGGQMRLESWSLTITGLTQDQVAPVPEARALLAACALAALILLRRPRH